MTWTTSSSIASRCAACSTARTGPAWRSDYRRLTAGAAARPPWGRRDPPERSDLWELRDLPERGGGGESLVGEGPAHHGLTVPPALGSGVEITDVDHGVADLVQLARQLRVTTVGQSLAVDVQFAAPLAVMMALPAEIEPGPQVEASVGGDVQLEVPF